MALDFLTVDALAPARGTRTASGLPLQAAITKSIQSYLQNSPDITGSRLAKRARCKLDLVVPVIFRQI
jgi:hypothetical protein